MSKGLLLLALTFGSTALAAPAQLHHTGRLIDTSGVPLDSTHSLELALYDAETGGSVLWSETQATVPFDNGYFAIELGADAGNPLEDADLDVTELWIELTVDGATLGRQQVLSVPYARFASRAATATALDGATLDDLTCGNDQVPVYSGTSWSCGDLQASVSWTSLSNLPAGFVDNIDDDALGALACGDGQLAAWSASGSAWVCVTDANTQLDESAVDGFVANNGYALSSGLAPIATSGNWSDIDGLPAGFLDGIDNDTHLDEAAVDGFVANNGYALANDLAPIATTGNWSDIRGMPGGFSDDVDNDTQLDEAAVDTFVANNGYALASETGIEVVQRDDPRLVYVPAVFDCVAGNWCSAAGNWGATALANDAYYTRCTDDSTDCSANYVDLVLNANTDRSVLFSHLDWSNTGLISVYLSFDGGASFIFHKAIDTYQPVSSGAASNFLTNTRVVASNLPLGQDVVVRLVASRGRLHQGGFGLTKMVYPEQVDNGFGRPTVVSGAGKDGTCDVSGVCDPTALAARKLTIVKTRDDTQLRLLYTDVMRSYGDDGVARACSWWVRFNGANCPSGEIRGDVLGSAGTDPHQPSAIGGVCRGLAAGTYNVQVYVGNKPNYAQGRCYTGWDDSTFSLEAQEIR